MIAPFVMVAVLVAGAAPAGSLTGTVLEDGSRTPLALAAVRIIQIFGHKVIAEPDTDGQGKFQAIELPPGEYRPRNFETKFPGHHG
jgi:hypothetical protein